jgi:TolA-binding protein
MFSFPSRFLVAVLAGVVLLPVEGDAQRAGKLEGKRIAVLEFLAGGRARISSPETLTDEARGAVVQATREHGASVLTRENMAEVLKATGGKCQEGECEVETARNLNVELFVVGSIAEIEGSLVLTLKAYETRSGTMLGQRRVQAQKELELLEKVAPATRTLSLEAFGLGVPTRSPAAPSQVVEGRFMEGGSPGLGRAEDDVLVSFVSNPPGATVLMDGALKCQATPCSKRLPPGPHAVVFEKERFSAVRLNVNAKEGDEVKAQLEPQFGWVSVESEPAGLKVLVNGREAGKTPLTGLEVDPGGVEISLGDPCYVRGGERFNLSAGQRRTVRLEAKPRVAGLKVDAEDATGNALSGMVVVDGSTVGAVGKSLVIPVCAKQVSLSLDASWSRALVLEEGKTTVLSYRAPAEPQRAEPAVEKKEERKGPAKFDFSKAPKLPDDARKEEEAHSGRERSIQRLVSIITKLNGESPQKAEMIFQLSELYWEKSKYLQAKEQRAYDERYAVYRAALDQGRREREPILDNRESELFRMNTMRLYEEILKDYPTYERKDEVLFNLAYNLYETGKKDPAVKRYEELIKGYPDSKLVPDAYIQLGNHHFENNALAKAEDTYKKAAATKIPKIYSYATYRLAWCDFNAGKFEDGLKKMQEVVSFSETNGKEYVDLKNEALGDMVTFYVQLDQDQVAIDYFRLHAPKKKQARLIGRLADGLAGAGHHEKAIRLYTYLVNESPMGPAAPEHQLAIVKSYEGLRQRDRVKSELKKLVDLYRPGSPWWTSNGGNVAALRNAFGVVEEAMRVTVTEYHQEAQKTKSVATYRLARDIYKEYVDAFASSADENFISDHAFNLRFYYADILWALEEWEAAAAQYDAVLAFKVPERESAKEVSQESYRKTAAYSAILAYDNLVRIEKGLLSRTELRENALIDEKKKKGTAEKRAQSRRLALSPDHMREKPLTRYESLLVSACDRYNGLYKDNPDEIEVRYLAAVTLFDKSQFVQAARRFGDIALKWPEEKRSQDAADLAMSVLEDKSEWQELNRLARDFLANKKLAKAGSAFGKRVAAVVEGTQNR